MWCSMEPAAAAAAAAAKRQRLIALVKNCNIMTAGAVEKLVLAQSDQLPLMCSPHRSVQADQVMRPPEYDMWQTLG